MYANLVPHSIIMPTHHLWISNFNWHHPLWDEPCNSHLFTRANLDLVQPLLNMLSSFNMKMALPPSIPTLKSHSTGNYTRVDNVFCNRNLLDLVIKCHTDDASHPVKTDHYPIITTLDIHTPKAIHAPRLNFHDVDWPELLNTLKPNLANISPPTVITNTDNFNQKLTALYTTVWDVINKNVKLSKPSPYSKRWWSTALAQDK